MTGDRRRLVRAALEEGRRRLEGSGLEDPLAEAELLLAAALGTERVGLHVDPPDLTTALRARYEGFVDRRSRREPSGYILGRVEFRSLSFRVDPAVLIPRPETEHLVEAALEWLGKARGATVVDVGTGSGCIAVSLAHARPDLRVAAVDRSAAALAVARENSRTLGTGDRIVFLRGDLLEAVRGPVDLVVSNPPYIAEGEEVDPEIAFEPREALYPGGDPVDLYARLARGAARVLRPGGILLVETPGARIGELTGAFREAGLSTLAPVADLQGRPRVLGAGKPRPTGETPPGDPRPPGARLR